MLEHLRIRRYLCYNSNMSKKANDVGNQQGSSGFRNLKPSETICRTRALNVLSAW